MSLPTVRFRNPFPPHEAWLDIDAIDLRYGFLLCRKQTASFSISRSDPNLTMFRNLIGVGLMASIERDDGKWPWVGYVTDFDDDPSEPHAQLVLTDYTFLLEQARTRFGGSASGASGRVIRDTLYEMDARGQPPLLLDLSALAENGPPLPWNYKAESGLSFLQRARDVTGWEWRLEPSIGQSVAVRALWQEKLGRDLRSQVRWEDGKDLVSVRYHARAKGFVDAMLMTGGAGDFDGLVAVAATAGVGPSDVQSIRHGQHRDTDVAASPVLLGTRQLHEYQVADAQALESGAKRLFDAPEYIAEALSLTVLDASIVDVAIGDIVTVSVETTIRPLKRYVRITGMQFDADQEVHEVECVVEACQC